MDAETSFRIISQTETRILAPLPELAIAYDAALYWLDGHYLFRSKAGEGWSSKFVTSSDVAAAFSGSEVDSGWLPSGVVRAGSNKCGKFFVYSTPAQKAVITFDGEEQPITIPLPRLVMLGVGAQYYLWALAEPHFNQDAKGYLAPFPNVHDDGQICWGANAPGQADPSKARRPWELFFATPFNKDLASGKSKSQKSDVRELLRSLAGKSKYPASDLVGIGILSIGAVIERRLED